MDVPYDVEALLLFGKQLDIKHRLICSGTGDENTSLTSSNLYTTFSGNFKQNNLIYTAEIWPANALAKSNKY